MSEATGTIFVFPPYRLDPERRSLLRDGAPLFLTPKEFDTLLVLIESNGKVVGKDELIARVWPDTYVGDGSLTRNISVLRKALGEGVIETLPRRGYRFSVPVTSGAASMVSSGAALVAAPDAPPAREGTKRRKRRFLVGAAIAAALLISLATSRFVAVRTARANRSVGNVSPIRSVLLQKQGGIDPLDEGFAIHANGKFSPFVVRNVTNDGFDRWRVVSDDLGYYYRGLSSAEKDFALQHDWKLTCVCALETGLGHVNIDLGADKGAPRFDIVFLRESDKYFVALTQQISPGLQFDRKIEFPGVADVDHPHTYELRYDHFSKTASLWIDGKQMASGYAGHRQFQEDRGLMFGASTYRDAKSGSMVFRTVRFQVE